MKEVIMGLDQQVYEVSGQYYIRELKSYYKKYKQTSEIQIDTLIIIYRTTKDEEAFALLLKCHEFLLRKLVSNAYNIYKQYLYTEDYNELYAMALEEFVRRVLFYKIPPEAPFSKYIKLYMKKWLYAYAGLMSKLNNKFYLGPLTDDLLINKISVHSGVFINNVIDAQD